MRNRNNRIAVRVTNKEIERINEMVSKSIFPKEKLIRLIVTGYPIQEKPSDDCMQLELTLGKLATNMGTLLFQGTEASKTSELVYETLNILTNVNYVRLMTVLSTSSVLIFITTFLPKHLTRSVPAVLLLSLLPVTRWIQRIRK